MNFANVLPCVSSLKGRGNHVNELLQKASEFRQIHSECRDQFGCGQMFARQTTQSTATWAQIQEIESSLQSKKQEMQSWIENIQAVRTKLTADLRKVKTLSNAKKQATAASKDHDAHLDKDIVDTVLKLNICVLGDMNSVRQLLSDEGCRQLLFNKELEYHPMTHGSNGSTAPQPQPHAVPSDSITLASRLVDELTHYQRQLHQAKIKEIRQTCENKILRSQLDHHQSWVKQLEGRTQMTERTLERDSLDSDLGPTRSNLRNVVEERDLLAGRLDAAQSEIRDAADDNKRLRQQLKTFQTDLKKSQTNYDVLFKKQDLLQGRLEELELSLQNVSEERDRAVSGKEATVASAAEVERRLRQRIDIFDAQLSREVVKSRNQLNTVHANMENWLNASVGWLPRNQWATFVRDFRPVADIRPSYSELWMVETPWRRRMHEEVASMGSRSAFLLAHLFRLSNAETVSKGDHDAVVAVLGIVSRRAAGGSKSATALVGNIPQVAAVLKARLAQSPQCLDMIVFQLQTLASCYDMPLPSYPKIEDVDHVSLPRTLSEIFRVHGPLDGQSLRERLKEAYGNNVYFVGDYGFHVLKGDDFWTLIDFPERTLRLIDHYMVDLASGLPPKLTVPSPCEAKWKSIVCENIEGKTDYWWTMHMEFSFAWHSSIDV